MVRNVKEFKPELTELRQHPSFIGNTVGQNPVECADPIRGDKKYPVAKVV
jgi:hypothetical protein